MSVFEPECQTNQDIDDPHFDTLWYMLIDGENILDFTDNYTWVGAIDQTVWGEMGNGTVIIRFFANDTAYNNGTSQITVRKDINAPVVFVIAPDNYEVFNDDRPEYNLTIAEINLHRMCIQWEVHFLI